MTRLWYVLLGGGVEVICTSVQVPAVNGWHRLTQAQRLKPLPGNGPLVVQPWISPGRMFMGKRIKCPHVPILDVLNVPAGELKAWGEFKVESKPG